MKNPKFKYFVYKGNSAIIDREALQEFVETNNYGKVSEADIAETLKTHLTVSVGSNKVTFNKLEVEFLKDLYGADYEILDSQELFQWKRLTYMELTAMVMNDPALAKLVEVVIRLGDIFIYQVENDPVDFYILIKLF